MVLCYNDTEGVNMMKKFMILLLIVLMLAGCSTEDPLPTTLPTEPTVPTEPPVPWVDDVGMEWDADGVLREIPLTIPDGLHLTAAMEFNGDLLLWSTDTHLADRTMVEMCLIELDDGSIVAQQDVEVTGYVFPQAVGDALYLCDPTQGVILELDRSLEIVNRHEIEVGESSIYMGMDGTCYRYLSDEELLVCDLTTGETEPLLEGNPAISWVTETRDTLLIKYYRTDNGAAAFAVLDLNTGECHLADTDEQVDSVSRVGDTWLLEKYIDNYVYYMQTGDEAPLRVLPQDGHLTLLDEGCLMETSMDGTWLRLYGLDGTLRSSCSFYETGSGYVSSDLIWNEAMGGYFFLTRSYDETARLLFWDVSRSAGGSDLTIAPVPEPDAVQAGLEARAEELETKYGLTILVGDQCDTQFDEFTASQTADWDQVMMALDTLDRALQVYPEGFIRQLRYDYIQGVQIQLVTDLMADGGGRTGDGYNAFTQPQWDYYLMVIDIEDSSEQTYYHEFSHIIDRCLEWDANLRDDALYSEDEWAAMNPGWFEGYTLDYSREHYILDDGWFVDSYSTISPTEDRARVLEYAMADYGGWVFEDGRGLRKKLDYYCRCIRDCFDTTGWPERVIWEQYL